MRALITYQERKFRREKRIKSKKCVCMRACVRVCVLALPIVVDILIAVHRFHKMQRKAKKQSKPEGDIEKADKLRAKVHIYVE